MDFIEIQKDDIRINNIVLLANIIWHEHYKNILSESQIDYMLEKFQSAKAINNQLDDKYTYYLLKENNIDIGFVGYYFEEDYLYLSKLYLIKEYRHKGFGHKIMGFIIYKAKEENKKKIVLNVNRYNTDSIKAYEALGFKRVREENNDIGENYFMEDYVYERNII